MEFWSQLPARDRALAVGAIIAILLAVGFGIFTYKQSQGKVTYVNTPKGWGLLRKQGKLDEDSPGGDASERAIPNARGAKPAASGQ